MNIREFYYNEDCRELTIEFSTQEDGDDYYRILELPIQEIFYYSPEPIDEDDIESLTDLEVVELIKQYLLENDLPDKLYL